MRPLRFILLVVCFIAIPVFLTCISLFSGQTHNANVFQQPQRSRLRALFSFSTPSALFPPTAIISLTFENSTFFLARPAAFGPALPSKGLSGQLWIGRGFGDDTLLPEDDLRVSGFELGCSDVPGWDDGQPKTPDHHSSNGKSSKKTEDDSATVKQSNNQIMSDLHDGEGVTAAGAPLENEEDGTDDHLHRPLRDSNPAPVVKLGEPADKHRQDKSQMSTHADIESLQESADIAGKIVMLSRGGCGFLEKVKWTQRRGGIAVIVGDNERSNQLTIMYAKGDTSNITIPAIFTSYTSAHLLSSLVPPELDIVANADTKKTAGSKDGVLETGKNKVNNANKIGGPVFTTTTMEEVQPTPKSVGGDSTQQEQQGWMQNVLQVVGIEDSSPHVEDSRRPPGSGNIEWLQVKDWDDDVVKTTSTGFQTSSTTGTPTSTTRYVKQQTTSKTGNDDFVIGVQDWRDTELIAPKSTSTTTGQQGKKQSDATNTASSAISRETELKGGSIIPGSGEYQKMDKDEQETDSSKVQGFQRKNRGSFLKTMTSWFSKSPKATTALSPTSNDDQKSSQTSKENHHNQEIEGLWLTLTPTSVSTSPFFDTLLVLVVSPLVTLTFVYGLLLLRSRIRRRRWRAPKSVVERLPVRTYHTFSTTSSTTSSHATTPDRSQASSPRLQAEPVRARQRSQTTIGILSPGSVSPPVSGQSPPKEKPLKQQPKRYRGRQVECVVCLEEYVDGESKVMSLPCGHEFHAECITPWLVNRRRTCPICKGDVVRSLQRYSTSAEEDNREAGEETADGVQERAATTLPDNSSTASIPIPEREDIQNIMDEDIERGEEAPTTEQDTQRPVGSRWRGIINASLV